MESSFCYQRPKLKDFLYGKCCKYLTFCAVMTLVVLSYFHFSLKSSPQEVESQYNTVELQTGDLNQNSDTSVNIGGRSRFLNAVRHTYKIDTLLDNKFCEDGIGLISRRPYDTLDMSAKEFMDSQEQDDSENTDDRNNSEIKQRFPKALVIGFAKCGTSALVTFLELSSSIKTAKKEIHFFDQDKIYEQGYEWYLNQMPYSTSDQITMEKTPSYVMNEAAPERIKLMNSSLKLIVTVKEPVSRALSEFSKLYVEGRTDENKSFDEHAVDMVTGKVKMYKPVKRSLYYLYLKKYFCHFPREQIHIVDGDNLVKNPVVELNKLERFLGLEEEITKEMVYFNKTKGFYCMKKSKNRPPLCLPPKKGREHQPIGPEALKILKKFYKPWNEKFFNQMGVRYNWD